MARQSSNALSRLASRIMTGAEATRQDIMKLAASVLSQDETKGSRTARKARKRGASASKTSARKTSARKTSARKTSARTSTATRRVAKKRK